MEALGKKKDSLETMEQLRQEKYKPLQNPIEEEKTEENVTIEGEDSYGISQKKGQGGMNSRAKLGEKLRSLEDGYSTSQEGSRKNIMEHSPSKAQKRGAGSGVRSAK